MKKFFPLTLLLAALTMLFSACSDDNKIEEKPVPDPDPIPTREAKCWKIYDGDFLTLEDIIVSSDSANININKAFLDRLVGEDDAIQKGDVIALFTHGYLNYFEATSVKENGEHYMSYDIKEIGLEKALGVLNIDMSNIQLSTEIFSDNSKPKRVNNSGEADSNGIMNTDIYIEKDAQGNNIIHPAAYFFPAYSNEDANGDGEVDAIPGGFVGCYIGQADNIEMANGWFSGIISVVKTVGKAIIAPVQAVATIVSDTAELLAKLAVGGQFDKEKKIIDIEADFSGYRWDLTSGKAADASDSGEDSKPLYTKEEWEYEMNAKCYLTLNGHFYAHAGARINLTLKPMKVEKFSVGAFADMDVDMNALLEVGVQQTLQRPVSIKRFSPKEFMFDIGPIPVLIVIYPETIWLTQYEANALLYGNFDLKYHMNYDANLHILPEFKPEVKAAEKPTGDFHLNALGIKGNVELKTGIYFRTSWELYGIAGPVFDVGHSISATSNSDIYVNDKWEVDGETNFELNLNIGDIQASGTIGFPPLKDISSWLYEKLSWHSETLIDVDPIYTIPLYPRPDDDDKD